MNKVTLDPYSLSSVDIFWLTHVTPLLVMGLFAFEGVGVVGGVGRVVVV